MAEEEKVTGAAPTGDEKLMSAIGYIGILFLIPLLGKKGSKFCQFHGKQAMVLFIAEVILSWIPFIGWFILAPILGIIGLIALIMAAMGNWWEIPVIGPLAKKFNF